MHNQTQEQKILKRAADWRNGAVVYQVIVDRFAPSKDIEKKKSKYPKHSKLKKWYDSPRKGNYNKKAGVWSHELDFWGGDLESLENKLDYIRDLQIDVLYLNPIFLSMTNHKYDTWDYSVVDPVYGNREDLFRLCEKVHEKDMKIVLDGVINHMGVKSPIFQTARDEKNSPYRDYFKFTDDNQWGYIGWMDVENLPELNLGNKKVRDYLYKKKESIIQSYIRYEDIDGWRLDVAHDLGFSILNELTLSAHKQNPDR